MNFWQSVGGILKIQITCADSELFLNTLSDAGVFLQNIESQDCLTVQCQILRTDWNIISQICKKQGCSLHILKRRGIYWKKDQILKRPVIVLWLLCFALFAGMVPTRVFILEVDGNNRIPDRMILEAAQTCGIHIGASRRAIRSEKMKNALLTALPELQWAGINTFGCRAVISVKEREQAEEINPFPEITSIIAARDGIVTQCTSVKGNPICNIGQAVKKDQLLISPYVNCGLSIKLVPAEGEVFAYTIRDYCVLAPDKHTVVHKNEEIQKRYSLIIGKKRVNLQNGSGISDTTYDRMYSEYYITLPGGYRLPICLAVERIIPRTALVTHTTKTVAEQILTSYSKNYVSSQMIAGNILSENHRITKGKDIWILDSSYVCNEMISRITTERNGVIHE